MNLNKQLTNLAGWAVFLVSLLVYYLSAERTGSLWDCGEFILGADKLQVVHPPGAPFFVLIGRLFAAFAHLFSNNPSDIAFAVNLMSGICTAFAATFVAWTAAILGKLILVGREGQANLGQNIALAGAGLVAGLSTAFATSIWFSAVEGEVYAMSTFFTALTLWSTVKWYALPDTPGADKWLAFTVYAAGLSIGVHLLSLLTFPALALFYYFKKYPKHTFGGIILAAVTGVVLVALAQKLVITGIPFVWSKFELFMVNDLGLPFHSGLIPTVLIVAGIIGAGLYYAHKSQNALLQQLTVCAALLVIGFSTIGVVVLRANANTPINMNAPSDALRLLPYLNREQYGERPLLRGPHFNSQIKRDPNGAPVVNREDRYGRVGDKYVVVDEKFDYEYAPVQVFPRMSDYTQGRPNVYKVWMGLNPDQPLPSGRPNFFDNLSYFFSYQIGWMYWRYFMWNFAGRQNGEQGFAPWDKANGHWISGIPLIDNARLYNQSSITPTMKNDPARNKYYMLPFIFGLIGLFFHFKNRGQDALGLLAFFVITGIGIIVYSNQPPNEPRERDYVLVGSFFAYCIWIGLGVVALYQFLQSRAKLSGPVSAGLAAALVLSAPVLMGSQNFDDHSRNGHYASRDYASNFLNSVAENAIIFTYGDNDTYPLWYAQEVEGIRPDVRVINLSLIAVDWYIDQQRRKINQSPAVKMTIPSEAYRGKKRNFVRYIDLNGDNAPDKETTLQNLMSSLSEDNASRAGIQGEETFYSTKSVYIPVDKQKILDLGVVGIEDTANIVPRLPINLATVGRDYLIKDELAVLDIIASNLWERPIYFAVTCVQSKLLGLQNYMQLEGLALRIVPIASQGEPTYSTLGSGRVQADIVYKNVMEKFKWGNFDKLDTHVDNSYMPSVQSQQFMLRRTAIDLLGKGDTTRALQLADKYFEAFPHMNFPYDLKTRYILDVYFMAGAYDKAKPHMEILAKETADKMKFYNSIEPSVMENTFGEERMTSMGLIENLISEAQKSKDQDLIDKMSSLLGPFRLNTQEQTPALPDGLKN